MAISLSKGGNLSLSKEAPAMVRILIGLGWDARETDGEPFDLDASIFMVGKDGKVSSDSDFIFYNQLKSTCGSVEHLGDNRTGSGDGDDEQIKVNLADIPKEIQKLSFTVTIHEADQRRQNFGMVNNAYIRVVNDESGIEVARFDLTEDAGTETAMIFGELYRHNGEWKFKAVGQGYAGGLEAVARQFGVNIA